MLFGGCQLPGKDVLAYRDEEISHVCVEETETFLSSPEQIYLPLSTREQFTLFHPY